MNIALVNQKIIKSYPGSNLEHLELPSNVARYFEFDNVVVFLLYKPNELKEFKIIGVKYSKEKYKLYIAWEFQITDGLGKIHEIVGMGIRNFNDQDVIYCSGWGFDIAYYLDPETGKVLNTEPIR
jgi:hypothetical protein